MLISDLFYCAFLTITITASCTQADSSSPDHEGYELSKDKGKKQMVKRDAFYIPSNFPYRRIIKHRPKFIYKRISNPIFEIPKPGYGITRSKHPSAKSGRTVVRKFRKSLNLKYPPSHHHKRPPKIRYANPRAQNLKPLFGLRKRSPSVYVTPIPQGFGEPPHDYINDHKISKTKHEDETATHAYGGHVKTVTKADNVTRNEDKLIDKDESDFPNQKSKPWETVYVDDIEGNYVEAESRPLCQIQKPKVADNSENSFPDIYNFKKMYKTDVYNNKRRKQKRGYKPRGKNRSLKQKVKRNRQGDRRVVGGRYAEPPARYIFSRKSGRPL